MSDNVSVAVKVIDEPVVSVQVDRPPVISSYVVGGGGPPGPPGPQGEPGEPGEAGTSAQSYPYRWRDTVDATDPGDGYAKTNHADEALATELYISIHDRNGQAFLPVLTLETGDELTLYEAGDVGTWNRYLLTGPVVLNVPIGSSPTWATIPIAYQESGPLPFTPGTNTSVLIVTPITMPVNITVSDTAPSNPSVNDVWIDTT